MMPKKYIEEWRAFSPWPENGQVEQDLIIEKAIVAIFSDAFLNENLTFRGGTALHKLFLKPQARYSEDIVEKKLEYNIDSPQIRLRNNMLANNLNLYKKHKKDIMKTQYKKPKNS